MFSFRKKTAVQRYDPEIAEPVIRSSICTGEKTAGFRDRKTGVFRHGKIYRCELCGYIGFLSIDPLGRAE